MLYIHSFNYSRPMYVIRPICLADIIGWTLIPSTAIKETIKWRYKSLRLTIPGVLLVNACSFLLIIRTCRDGMCVL